MTAKLQSLPLALLLVSVIAGPAAAGGDVIYTGIKMPGAAVPVPAPIPVEVYQPDYYVRVDVGASWMSGSSVDEVGTPMGMNGSIEAMEFGSLGFGRYITPSVRVELAVDLYSRANLTATNTTFNVDVTPHDPATGSYNVTRQERVKFEQDLGMLNFYYDFQNGSRFTPYIGAGIGVTYRQLERTASETARCLNPPAPNHTCPANVVETTQNKQRWDLAAAAMAGFTYAVTEDVWIDTSYRYLWQNADLTLAADTLTGTSVVEVKDINQHQFRTGVRLNLN